MILPGWGRDDFHTNQGEFMKPLCKLLTVIVLLLWAGGAWAHEFSMPIAVSADGSGHFEFDVVVTISSPTLFGSSEIDGTDNTDVVHTWADGFCLGTWAAGTYVETVAGNLLDPAVGGSVMYRHDMCDGWVGTGTTMILPPTVGTEPVAWSLIKALYR